MHVIHIYHRLGDCHILIFPFHALKAGIIKPFSPALPFHIFLFSTGYIVHGLPWWLRW